MSYGNNDDQAAEKICNKRMQMAKTNTNVIIITNVMKDV